MRKYEELKQYLRELGSVAVAFSGGADSALLLYAAHEALGEHVLAITARSSSFPERELKEAAAFCAKEGIRHVICDSEELRIEGFAENPIDRCYLCKNELFTKIRAAARHYKIQNIAEGSNLDDDSDYRPGLTAIHEQDVKSPLRHVGLTKKEIRELSRELGLPTWNKPSFACLASRIPYGEPITPERLARIDRAEQILLNLGIKQVRVRHHNNLARIETSEDGFAIIADKEQREKIYREFQELGFMYVTLDLIGYRTGSMNDILKGNA